MVTWHGSVGADPTGGTRRSPEREQEKHGGGDDDAGCDAGVVSDDVPPRCDRVGDQRCLRGVDADRDGPTAHGRDGIVPRAARPGVTRLVPGEHLGFGRAGVA